MERGRPRTGPRPLPVPPGTASNSTLFAPLFHNGSTEHSSALTQRFARKEMNTEVPRAAKIELGGPDTEDENDVVYPNTRAGSSWTQGTTRAKKFHIPTAFRSSKTSQDSLLSPINTTTTNSNNFPEKLSAPRQGSTGHDRTFSNVSSASGGSSLKPKFLDDLRIDIIGNNSIFRGSSSRNSKNAGGPVQDTYRGGVNTFKFQKELKGIKLPGGNSSNSNNSNSFTPTFNFSPLKIDFDELDSPLDDLRRVPPPQEVLADHSDKTVLSHSPLNANHETLLPISPAYDQLKPLVENPNLPSLLSFSSSDATPTVSNSPASSKVRTKSSGATSLNLFDHLGAAKAIGFIRGKPSSGASPVGSGSINISEYQSSLNSGTIREIYASGLYTDGLLNAGIFDYSKSQELTPDSLPSLSTQMKSKEIAGNSAKNSRLQLDIPLLDDIPRLSTTDLLELIPPAVSNPKSKLTPLKTDTIKYKEGQFPLSPQRVLSSARDAFSPFSIAQTPQVLNRGPLLGGINGEEVEGVEETKSQTPSHPSRSNNIGSQNKNKKSLHNRAGNGNNKRSIGSFGSIRSKIRFGSRRRKGSSIMSNGQKKFNVKKTKGSNLKYSRRRVITADGEYLDDFMYDEEDPIWVKDYVDNGPNRDSIQTFIRIPKRKLLLKVNPLGVRKRPRNPLKSLNGGPSGLIPIWFLVDIIRDLKDNPKLMVASRGPVTRTGSVLELDAHIEREEMGEEYNLRTFIKVVMGRATLCEEAQKLQRRKQVDIRSELMDAEELARKRMGDNDPDVDDIERLKLAEMQRKYDTFVESMLPEIFMYYYILDIRTISGRNVSSNSFISTTDGKYEYEDYYYCDIPVFIDRRHLFEQYSYTINAQRTINLDSKKRQNTGLISRASSSASSSSGASIQSSRSSLSSIHMLTGSNAGPNYKSDNDIPVTIWSKLFSRKQDSLDQANSNVKSVSNFNRQEEKKIVLSNYRIPRNAFWENRDDVDDAKNEVNLPNELQQVKENFDNSKPSSRRPLVSKLLNKSSSRFKRFIHRDSSEGKLAKQSPTAMDLIDKKIIIQLVDNRKSLDRIRHDSVLNKIHGPRNRYRNQHLRPDGPHSAFLSPHEEEDDNHTSPMTKASSPTSANYAFYDKTPIDVALKRTADSTHRIRTANANIDRLVTMAGGNNANMRTWTAIQMGNRVNGNGYKNFGSINRDRYGTISGGYHKHEEFAFRLDSLMANNDFRDENDDLLSSDMTGARNTRGGNAKVVDTESLGLSQTSWSSKGLTDLIPRDELATKENDTEPPMTPKADPESGPHPMSSAARERVRRVEEWLATQTHPSDSNIHTAEDELTPNESMIPHDITPLEKPKSPGDISEPARPRTSPVEIRPIASSLNNNGGSTAKSFVFGWSPPAAGETPPGNVPMHTILARGDHYRAGVSVGLAPT